MLFPHISAGQIKAIMLGCAAVALAAGGALVLRSRRSSDGPRQAVDRAGRDSWRMPRLAVLAVPPISAARKLGLTALRAYLAVAMILVIIKIAEVALAH